MGNGQRVRVLGAGVIGLSAAFRLAQAGYSVSVLERGVPGAEASSAAGGILGPQIECDRPGPMLELCLRSRTLYPAFVKELEALSGVDVGYRESGILRLAFDDAEAQGLAETAAWQRAVGLRAELLDSAELREREPEVSEEAVAALSLPDDHQVEPPLLVRALLGACERVGVKILRTEVQGLTSRGGRVTGVRTSGGELEAEAVVVAMGAWSAQLLEAEVQIEPVRGQILELRAEPKLLRHLLKTSGAYLVSRSDGRVLVGSTMERVGFEKGVTEEAMARLQAAAIRACPALHQATVHATWSGLRPATPNYLPVISDGPLTGLVLSTGHFRNGILLAPVTARTVVERVAACVNSS